MSFFESSTLWCCLIPSCRSCSVVLFYLQLVGSLQGCSTTSSQEKIKDNEPSCKVKNVRLIWKEPLGESIRLMSSSIAVYLGRGNVIVSAFGYLLIGVKPILCRKCPSVQSEASVAQLVSCLIVTQGTCEIGCEPIVG